MSPRNPTRRRAGVERWLQLIARRIANRNAQRNADEAGARSQAVTSLPTLLTVESTSVCNLACVMCEHGPGIVERPRHFAEKLTTKLSAVLRVARSVQLHSLGEPLLAPAFWRILESTPARPDLDIGANTNGLLLDEKRVRRLLDSGISYLNVSIDAATPETYLKIRGADLERVVDGVGRLVRMRNAEGRERPMILANMTMMRENIEELPAFVELAASLGVDRIDLWHLNQLYDWEVERDGWTFVYTEQELRNHPELSNRMIREAVRRAEQLGIELLLDWNKPVWFEEAGAGDPGRPATGESTATVADCTYPWNWAVVQTDGGVRPCCFSEGSLGNLNEKSFAQIWRGEKAKQLRRSVAAGELHPMCANAACKYSLGSRAVPAAKSRL